MHDQKEDTWVHTYTHTEEDPYLLCLVLSCRKEHLIVQSRTAAWNWRLRRGHQVHSLRILSDARKPCSSSCSQLSSLAGHVLLCINTYRNCELRRVRPHMWEAALAPWLGRKLGQAGPSCCSGSGNQGLKVDGSPVAQERALNTSKLLVRSPFLTVLSVCLGSRSISHPKFQKVTVSARNYDFAVPTFFQRKVIFWENLWYWI